jgi:esterase/lipase superfamily enzyme
MKAHGKFGLREFVAICMGWGVLGWLAACADIKPLQAEIADLKARLAKVEQESAKAQSQPSRVNSAPVPAATSGRVSKCAGCTALPPVRPTYRVWFGTNRKPTSDAAAFSELRDTSLSLGYCDVYVPSTHLFGEIGSSWFWRTITFDDDRLKIDNIKALSQSDWLTLMSEDLKRAPPGHRSALVYIHGYNNSFTDAAIRAAQIGYDLKVDGITAFFSWPSKGSVAQYLADTNTVDASEAYLKQFLETLSLNADIDRVDILAHSMGNRALLRTVAKLRADSSIKPIRHIILAAPDVDAQLFGQLAVDYPKLATGTTTLYVSSKDRAINASEILADFPRAGYEPPVVIVDGIDTVDASDVDFGLLGHGYYAESGAVLHDMFDILHHGDRASARQQLHQVTDERGRLYWTLR